jgi:hypothetical protein
MIDPLCCSRSGPEKKAAGGKMGYALLLTRVFPRSSIDEELHGDKGEGMLLFQYKNKAIREHHPLENRYGL